MFKTVVLIWHIFTKSGKFSNAYEVSTILYLFTLHDSVTCQQSLSTIIIYSQIIMLTKRAFYDMNLVL